MCKMTKEGIEIAMRNAAKKGHIESVKLYKQFGATDYDLPMKNSAKNGHIKIVKLCKVWDATDYEWAMCEAAKNGHIEIVKLCKEWLWRQNITGLREMKH